MSRGERSDAFLAQLSPAERGLFDAERLAAAERLAESERPTRIVAAAGHAFSSSNELGKRHLQLLKPAQAIACREGCHACCHLKVSVTAPEVLALADFIATRLPRAERERIGEKAVALAKDPRIFSEYAKAEARIPCALLTDAGACAAYEARPLACRGWTSTDAEACRRALDDDAVFIPLNQRWAGESAAVGLGLRAAVMDAGLPGEILELTTALAIALCTPRALERWLEGEALFAPARAGS